MEDEMAATTTVSSTSESTSANDEPNNINSKSRANTMNNNDIDCNSINDHDRITSNNKCQSRIDHDIEQIGFRSRSSSGGIVTSLDNYNNNNLTSNTNNPELLLNFVIHIRHNLENDSPITDKRRSRSTTTTTTTTTSTIIDTTCDSNETQLRDKNTCTVNDDDVEHCSYRRNDNNVHHTNCYNDPEPSDISTITTTYPKRIGGQQHQPSMKQLHKSSRRNIFLMILCGIVSLITIAGISFLITLILCSPESQPSHDDNHHHNHNNDTNNDALPPTRGWNVPSLPPSVEERRNPNTSTPTSSPPVPVPVRPTIDTISIVNKNKNNTNHDDDDDNNNNNDNENNNNNNDNNTNDNNDDENNGNDDNDDDNNGNNYHDNNNGNDNNNRSPTTTIPPTKSPTLSTIFSPFVYNIDEKVPSSN